MLKNGCSWNEERALIRVKLAQVSKRDKDVPNVLGIRKGCGEDVLSRVKISVGTALQKHNTERSYSMPERAFERDE